jgi:hypothetical protein
MKKATLSVVALTLAAIPFLPIQAQGDTFFGVLVPMPTQVTLSSSEVSLTIGTTTALAYGGGDGTGSYRFNNLASSFCSISLSGVVSANFPGSCRFTVTRSASGNYLESTSTALNITALPEPDKSVISTPSPDPTATPRATATPTPTASPQSSPAAVVTKVLVSPRETTVNDTAVKAPVNVPLKKVSGINAVLAPAIGVSTYKFSWASNQAAVSYSINLVTPEGKKAFTSDTASINLDELKPGTYTLEIQAIDSKGKLSTPVLSKFSISAPKIVKLTAATSLVKPVINKELAALLDGFSLRTTPGTAMKLSIEYSKSKSNDANAKKLLSAVEKYLADKRNGSPLKITLVPVKESGDIAVIRGLGEKKSATVLLRR